VKVIGEEPVPVPHFHQSTTWTALGMNLGLHGKRLATNCLSQKYILIKYIDLLVKKMFCKEIIHIFLQYDMFSMNGILITTKFNHHLHTEVASMLIPM
jgi:hypothetical protein